MDALLFGLFATVAIICAISLILQSHPVSSALSLIGVMGSLAMLYLCSARPSPAAARDRLRLRHHGALRLRHHAAQPE
jgi:NADH-quinone oxidoreductase subunit J